jgi:hypothetical protein
MTELVPRYDIPDDEFALFEYLAELVEQARHVASLRVNATLTMRNWLIGRAINVNVLRHKRADYGKQIVAKLSQQLTKRFDTQTLRRVVQFF